MPKMQDKNSQMGYIHHVSPIKSSIKKKGLEWYDFQIQTSPSKVRRVVGFNTEVYNSLKEYEASKTPIHIKNCAASKTGEDIIFGQKSLLKPAVNSDINFEIVSQPIPEIGRFQQTTHELAIKQINELAINQFVTVTGVVSMGNAESRKIEVKSNGQLVEVKDDYVLEDDTGNISLHVWGALIGQIKDGISYKFTNLVLKQFEGKRFLSTTRATECTETNHEFTNLVGPSLVKSEDILLKVDYVKFVAKLEIFTSCQVCNRKIQDDISSLTLKCASCGIRQRKASCKKDASVHLCLVNENNEIWLKAFTKVLEILLKDNSRKCSINSTAEAIEEVIMELEGFSLKYDPKTKVIKEVLFAPSSQAISTAEELSCDSADTENTNP